MFVSTMGGGSWGASEELWAATAEQALACGHEVGISVYDWPSAPEMLQRLGRKGAQIWRRRRGDGTRLARLTRRLRSPYAHIGEFRPDVTLVSQGGTYDALHLPGLAATLAELGKPFALLCHANTEIVEPTIRARASDLFGRAALLGFFSNHSRRICEQQLARELPNAMVLQNPIKLADYTPLPWPAGAGAKFASVARLDVWHKGHDLMFEALAQPAWADRDWRLTLYGEGHDQAYLQALTAFHGIAERVTFGGFVADVRAIWATNHMLLVSSRLRETVPLVLVEAMLCGRPVVATEVGIAPELIEDGRAGFLADAPVAKAFGRALERAWSTQHRWEDMGLFANQDAIAAMDPSPASTLLTALFERARPGAAAG